MKKLLFISALFCSIITFSQHKLEAKKETKQKISFTLEKENPLYIVNNKKVSQKVASEINPDDIKQINVYKNDKAIELYGKAGKNGVVVIILKNNKKLIKNKKLKK